MSGSLGRALESARNNSLFAHLDVHFVERGELLCTSRVENFKLEGKYKGGLRISRMREETNFYPFSVDHEFPTVLLWNEPL